MGDTKKDPYLSTKLRIAGNVAGAIYAKYAHYAAPVDISLDKVASDAVRLTDLIFERMTGGSRG